MATEEYAIGREHVLRHRFAPCEQLRRDFAELNELPPGSTAPRFFLSSTRTVSVDGIGFQLNWYDNDIKSIENEFKKRGREKAYNAMSIDNASAKYIAASGTLRVAFTPKSQSGFELITDPLMNIGVERERAEGEPYQIVLDIRQKLIGREAVERTRQVWNRILNGLRDDNSAHNYTFSPYDIVGRDVLTRIPLIVPTPDEPSEPALPGGSS